MAWIQDTYSKTLGHGGLDAIGIQQTFFLKCFPVFIFSLRRYVRRTRTYPLYNTPAAQIHIQYM